MSRRRVSVKDLGEADCQGWLQRRKDGRSFLGSKWKRYWFVLKKSSLYWYCNKEAEKAEGFINLTGFIIEEAKACRKKHVITATHPHLVTIFIAADSFADMNKWLSRLCDAAEPNELISAEGSYSEDSDQENDTPEATCRDLDPEPDQREPEAATEPSSPSCCRDAESQLHPERFPFLSSQAEEAPPPSGSQSSDSRTRTQSSSSSLHLMVDLPGPGEAARNLQLCIPEEAEGTYLHCPLVTMTTTAASSHRDHPASTERPSDEMESLYEGLKAARLSPIGQRDFRASFIRRSRNEKVNEKLHLLRILSSTLKAKELELQLMEQIMEQPDLQAPTYRQWKESNQILLEDILQPSRPAGGAANLGPETADN